MAFRSDEGRGYRRNVSGNWKQVKIRKCPNEETLILFIEFIYNTKSKPRKLKHLSIWRKRKQKCDSLSSGERNGEKPKLCIKGSGNNIKN